MKMRYALPAIALSLTLASYDSAQAMPNPSRDLGCASPRLFLGQGTLEERASVAVLTKNLELEMPYGDEVIAFSAPIPSDDGTGNDEEYKISILGELIDVYRQRPRC